MKPSAIEAGKKYVNNGAGLTARTVVKIIRNPAQNELPPWFSPAPRPEDEPVVVFTQNNRPGEHRLYLRSFASWAGKEVSTFSGKA